MNFIVKYRYEIGLYCVDVSNFSSYFSFLYGMIVVFAKTDKDSLVKCSTRRKIN